MTPFFKIILVWSYFLITFNERIKILTAVVMSVAIFTDIASRSTYVNSRFGSSLATCCTLVSCLADFRPWRWRWYFLPKRQFTQDYRGWPPSSCDVFLLLLTLSCMQEYIFLHFSTAKETSFDVRFWGVSRFTQYLKANAPGSTPKRSTAAFLHTLTHFTFTIIFTSPLVVQTVSERLSTDWLPVRCRHRLVGSLFSSIRKEASSRCFQANLPRVIKQPERNGEIRFPAPPPSPALPYHGEAAGTPGLRLRTDSTLLCCIVTFRGKA
jgi:hypothetical protein